MATKRSTTTAKRAPKQFELTVKMPGLEAALAALVATAREAIERDHAHSAYRLKEEEYRTEQAELAHEVSIARTLLERDELALRRVEFDERVAERAERKAAEKRGDAPAVRTKDW